MRIKVLAAGLILSWATASFAEAAPPPPTFKFEMHGFATGTVYYQNGNLGPGEGSISMWNNPPSKAQPVASQDQMVLGGDVRQNRINWSVSGPAVFGGATPKAVFEIDFFNNYGGGSYGDVSITPRMRIAYSELNWGANRIQIGQQNDIIFALAPVSLAHITFPVSYGTGSVGWRRPGIFGYHTFGDLKDKDATKFEFAWQVGRAQWQDLAGIGNIMLTSRAAGGFGDAYGFNMSEASGIPAVEARLSVIGGQTYSFWVGGHYQSTDRNGVGNLLGATVCGTRCGDSLDTLLGNAGGKVVVGPLTLAASGYYGKNTGPEVGSFLQFTALNAGDVTDYGAWVNVGLNLTKELSVWGYLGDEQTNHAEAIAAGFNKLGELTYGGLLQYRDGGYAVGFEWYHFRTQTTGAAEFGGPIVDSNQFLLSGNYFF